MTGNRNAWRAPLAGLASVAMLATMGVAAGTANAVEYGEVPAGVSANSGTPSFTVTYDLNGRGAWQASAAKKTVTDASNGYKLASSTTSQETAAGQIVDSDPSMSGVQSEDKAYTFAGWWTSPTIGEGEQLGPDAVVTKDVTLYAHWAKNDDLKTVAFNADGLATVPADLDVYESGNQTEATLAKGDKLSAWQKPVDKDGSDHAAAAGTAEQVDGKILDESKWSKDVENGTNTFDLSSPVTEDLTLSPVYATAHVVSFINVPAGYDFHGAGWQYEVADGGKVEAPVVTTGSGASLEAVAAWDVVDSQNKPASLDNVKDDLTVTARKNTTGDILTNEAYKVTYAVNSNDWADHLGMPDSVKNAWGPRDASGNNAYAFGTIASPAWNNGYAALVKQAYFVKGQKATLPEVNLYDGLYKVSNWYWAKKNGASNTATKYAETGSLTVDQIDAADPEGANHDLWLVAMLTPVAQQQVTVKFDLNYTGAPAPTSSTFAKDAKIVAPADPEREGYHFDGWFKDVPNPANPAATDSAWLTSKSKAEADATYYAQWTPTAHYELDSLLALSNNNTGNDNTVGGKAWKVYTDNSYAKYEAVRAALQKDSEGRITATGHEANGTVTADPADIKYYTYAANYDDPTLTDDVIAEYVKTLTAAKDQLRYTAEARTAFTDVNELTPHAEAIWTLASQGVVKGYADGTFRGLDGLNRQDFAAFLYRLAGEPEFDPAKATKTFSDVNASTPHYKAILWAASNGIVNGYGDVFKGMDLINRQDAAAMLYRLAGSPRFDGNTVSNFTDVKAGDEANHATAILWAASKGIVRGYTDGSFKGMDTIARQDAAAFLYRTMNAYDIPALYK